MRREWTDGQWRLNEFDMSGLSLDHPVLVYGDRAHIHAIAGFVTVLLSSA
jgi:hypothetical protein